MKHKESSEPLFRAPSSVVRKQDEMASLDRKLRFALLVKYLALQDLVGSIFQRAAYAC